MTNWTKGPWRVREMGDDFFVEANGSSKMPYALDVCGDDYTGHGDEEQRRHNFHLISAAPELYEALDAMLNDGDWIGDDWVPRECSSKKAEKALAKARGES